MTRFMRGIVCIAASAAMWSVGTDVGSGAGAMAVGTCAAYGYAFDFVSPLEARTNAMNKCADGRCKVVLTLRRSCAAFAIDARNACGPHGYAAAHRLGQAQNTAMRYCYNNGGKDCVIRAWACDAKG